MSLPTTSTAPYVGRQVRGLFRLWLDGVGVYLLCLDHHLRIGGPTHQADERAEISLLSNLSRHHARLIRSGEVWLLEPLGPTAVNGNLIVRHTLLNDGNQVQLGSSVNLRIYIPSPLSGTARLELESGHQTQPAVDGVILFAETCVIGTSQDAHIVCIGEMEQVLLIRRPHGLWCKSTESIQVDGVDSGMEVMCEAGKVYGGVNWQFRLEAVAAS